MKALGLAGLAVLATGGGIAAPAAAWPYLDVVSCETVSLDPPRYRTTFTITEVGFRPQYWDIMVLPQGPTPGSPDQTRLYDAGASQGWETYVDAPGGATQVYFATFGTSGHPPGPSSTFWLVADRCAPCVRIKFIDNLLGGGPGPYAQDIVACLDVDLPVPARSSSWGALKSVYR